MLLLCYWKSYSAVQQWSTNLKPQQKHVAVEINYCVHTWLHLCQIAMITSLDAYQRLPLVECLWLHKSQLQSPPVLRSHCIASSYRENRHSWRDSCSRDACLWWWCCVVSLCIRRRGVGVLEGVVARATGNICDWRCTPQTMAALLSIQTVRLPTTCQQSPRSKRVSHTPPAATPFLVPTHLVTCFSTFSSPS